jgi:hypothetical protein
MKIQKLYEDRGLLNESPNSNKQILTELISDSSFQEPTRIPIKVIPTDTDMSTEEISNKVSKAIEKTILGLDFLMDSGDGEYVVCFPGRKDWAKKLCTNIKKEFDGKVHTKLQ